MNATKPRFPWEANGATYCTMPDGSRHCTGSMMGRSNVIPSDWPAPRKFNLRHVPFVGGCYDTGGAYWGSPANMFCAWGESDVSQAVFYVRAKDRNEARKLVLFRFPAATFYR